MIKMEKQRIELTLDGVFGAGWELAKKHWGWLLLLGIALALVEEIPGNTINGVYLKMVPEMSKGAIDYEKLNEMLADALFSVRTLVSTVVSVLIAAYLSLVTMRYLKLAAMENGAIDVKEIFLGSGGRYLHFLATMFLCYMVIVVGLCCCVLPGFYLMVRLLFVPFIAANEPELSIGEAFSRSFALTRGRFWQLIWFGFAALIINIVGFCCCCVGVLYSEIVSELMLAHLYVVLSDDVCATPCEAPAGEEGVYVKNI